MPSSRLFRILVKTIMLSVMILSMVTTAAYTENVTLEVWNSDALPAALDWYNKTLIPAFEKAHPGVKVNLVKTPWGQPLTEKLATTYASGLGPDIVYGGAEFVDGYVENGFVIPIDSMVEKWGQTKDYIPGTLGAVTYKVHTYGLPIQMDFRTPMINKQLFSESGVDPNSPPRTWDDFTKTAKRLTRFSDGTTLAVAGMCIIEGYPTLNQMVWQNGGDILNADKTAPAFTSDAAVEALTYWTNAVLQITGPKQLCGANDMINGKLAMFYQNNPIRVVEPLRNAGVDIDALLGVTPALKQKVAVSAIFTNWMGIGSQSKHPDLAWEFLKFHSEIENYVGYLEANAAVPARMSALQTKYVKQNPWLVKALTYASQFGKPTWTATEFARLRDTLNPELSKAYKGTVSAREALETAANQWRTILAGSKK